MLELVHDGGQLVEICLDGGVQPRPEDMIERKLLGTDRWWVHAEVTMLCSEIRVIQPN